MLSEEGGEGGGGDVLGDEAEDLYDLTARIVLGLLARKLGFCPLELVLVRESGYRWIIRRARNTRELLYFWLLQAS